MNDEEFCEVKLERQGFEATVKSWTLYYKEGGRRFKLRKNKKFE